MRRVLLAPAGLGVVLGLMLVGPVPSGGHGEVEQRTLLDNERVLVVEYVFPPGFRGEEHTAPVDEFAYVLEGELGVVTRGEGRQRVRAGEVEWASRGTVHFSVNDGPEPARVLVVLLKER